MRRPRSAVKGRFIGRASELHLFREHLLKPEDPTYNVLSVWGPTGVGKTTLLARLRDEARTADCNESCLIALVDERFFTPADLMERCAAQLRLAGAPLAAFEQVAARYTQTLQPRHDEQTVARAAFSREVAALTEAKMMDASVVGGMYEAVAREANASFGNQHSASHPVGETGLLHDPLEDLIRAFVDDLNWLTTASSQRTGRGRRVILFFDTCTPAAAETVTWLLHAVLRVPISNQVVLVVAGREPIVRSLPGGQSVYSMSLAPFTEDETRTYLAEHGITSVDLVATIWHLSGGLPLYVGMLAGDQGRYIDVTADIVTNMLHWIAAQDQRKQRLVLHAALFSRPFTQDDLAAFHMLPEQARTSHYRWLIDLPFVRHSTLDGRHRYHDLAQQVMRRVLFQHAPQEEQATRRALANHYRRQLERMQAAEGKRAFCSAEWLELALALVSQLLSLPDAESHALAIEQVMAIIHEAKHEQELVTTLHELSQDIPEEHPAPLASTSARQTAHLLLQYIEMELARQEVLTAATDLLEVARHAPTFSAPLLARIYGKQGMAFSARSEYEQAIADFDRALALDPLYAGAYLLRGIAFSTRSEYEQAIADFDRALALDARATFAYAHRGIASWKRKNYQQAIADFDQAATLDQELEGAQILRRLAAWERMAYRPGRGDFDRAIALDPNDTQAHVLRGMACCLLDEAQQAIQSFDQVLDLEPNNAWAYAGRAHVSLEMGQIEQARADLLRSQQLAPDDIYGGLLLAWIDLCQEKSLPDQPDILARLEALAAFDRQQPATALCRGVALLLRERFEEALTAFEQALLQSPGMRAAFFWKSLACAFLGRNEEAAAALGQVRASDVPLPKVLLAPLHWLEQKNLHFYSTYAVPELENP
ncbi:MAG: tetratricopeptide repeat protein [Chloroflexota bacterium]|nr:tetratricopeptide repeat protein [Chloroflexota bacterium]